MSNIINFPTKPTSHYFHPTPDHSTTPARKKREILLSLGWSEYEHHGCIVYSNPDVCDNRGMYLDTAWDAQCLRELGQRYWN